MLKSRRETESKASQTGTPSSAFEKRQTAVALFGCRLANQAYRETTFPETSVPSKS